MKCTAIVLAAALAAVPVLSARGDEKKPSPAPKKVFTEDDLRSAGRPKGTVSQPGSVSEPEPAASPSPGASPAAGASPSPEPTDEEKRAASAKEFQRHVNHYAKEIATRRASIDKAQLELNDLTDYSVGGRRASLIDQIAVWEKEIKDAEQDIANVEEQARRAGVRVSRP
jgi:hypothetical protein